jgi:3'(2'), 5'-bisphosphate nucleotidase
MPTLSAHFSLALEAAIHASMEILRIYEEDFETILKEDGSPLTAADLASSGIIQHFLERTGIPITGEETVKSSFSEREKWLKSWCVDPLDGTKEFVSRNGEFAVNIALIEHGKPIFGLIAAPVAKEFIIGSMDFGVYIGNFENWQDATKWEKLSPVQHLNHPLVMVGSRSHGDGELEKLSEQIKGRVGEVQTFCKGSSLKFFDLATGRVDVYPRFAPTMEWDIASGQAILEALGGKVLDANTGKALTYNKKSLLNPYFVAYTQGAFEKLCEIS